ncbi:hypothetical protein FQR65_LT00548 [Abscondita terminalis]|nr:hypothetical protein FQR65_LT00548 [Abscondita terminalis]
MYNLNVNLAQSAANAVNNLLSVDNACTTPRTPEILNSLIAMTNPLDNYNFGDDPPKTATNGPLTSLSNDSNSSSCSQLESPTTTPPSIQHTCSQLIKAGLKLSIEQKRKHNSESEDFLDLDHCKRIKKSESDSEDRKNEGVSVFMNRYHKILINNHRDSLTAEDEERRRRRRERNKIAATKCRLKKREKTINLIQESQTLDDQNVDLKKQLQELQNQRRQLHEMLSSHRPHCKHGVPRVSRDSVTSRLPPLFSLSNSVIESNHSYSRPASVDPSFKAQTINIYNRPASVGVTSDASYNRSMIQYNKLPNIIIEETPVDSYQPQFLNLDDPESITYQYNNQPCHNYNGNQSYNSTGLDNGCMA